MMTSNLSRVPAELQQKKDPLRGGGAQGPNSPAAASRSPTGQAASSDP